jgi:2-phosphosulfolactate phosphatase
MSGTTPDPQPAPATRLDAAAQPGTADAAQTSIAPQQAAVRLEWGPTGAQASSEPCRALVIVDVLSFSTSVTISAGRGAAVYPHPWPAPELDLETFAAANGASLAVPRRQVSSAHPWSLSPASLLSAPIPDRLVLPSPNGSAIAATASAGRVLAGCLRNATSVARWLEAHGFATPRYPAVVIAAGERWPNGELRPALEDLLGAGAIIAALTGLASRSAEASAAEACWRACRHRSGEYLRDCSSGRELTASGYASDVTLAAEHDAQFTVPVLIDGAFRADAQP